ncbi:MAG: PAS domain S-box protein [Cyanobacteria bacterium J06649_5]
MQADPFSSHSPSVSAAVIPVPVAVPPETLVEDAIARMQAAQSSCVLITQAGCPRGIFTERDLVRLMASNRSFEGIPLATVMTPEVRTLRAADIKNTFSLFQQMQQLKLRHFPVVDEGGQLAGLITLQSLRKALPPSTLLTLKRVEDAMDTQVVCAAATARVHQIAQKMIQNSTGHSVSCVVIVTADDRPVGIITERDLVQFQTLGLDTQTTTAQTVMSTPLLPTNAKDSLWETHQRMSQHRVRRFVVCTREGKLAGLVTQASLLQSLNPAEGQQMIELLQSKLTQLRSENQALLEARNRELERAQMSLTSKLHTEQVAHQQADSQILFQAGLLDAVAQSVIATDLQGQIVYWNPYAQTLYGWAATAVLGRSLVEMMCHGYEQAKVADLLERVQRGESWSGELVVRRQDNTQLLVWVRWSPIFDERGQGIGTVSVSEDISDRKRLEAEQAQAAAELKQAYTQLDRANEVLESRVTLRTAELRQTEHRWRTLLENVQLIVIGLDSDAKVTYANPYFLNTTGYRHDEVIGKHWFDYFVPPSDQAAMTRYFQQLHSPSDSPLHYQNSILTSVGEERIVAWNNTLLRDLQNAVIGTMSIGEDITERFAVDRIKGAFVAMVSHELRTPLTAIHGGVKLLSQGIVPSDSEQGKSLLQVVSKNSHRLVRLVDDILALERLGAEEHPMQMRLINTQEATRHAVAALQVTADQAGIVIEVSDPGLSLMADGDRLNQALSNLLDNAITFSPRGSTICLSVIGQEATVHRQKSALFTICDQGEGIPAEHCENIFERFVQATPTSTSEKGRAGLGLTICRAIVTQHGGRIWVESEPGKGSCFYFTIPMM